VRRGRSPRAEVSVRRWRAPRTSRRPHGQAVDLVVEGEEPLAGEVEAVVGLQLAVGDVDVDPLPEIEQLEDGQGVSLAVDRAQVVAGVREVGSRRQDEVVLALVAGRRVAVKLALGIGKPTLT
jgi:hypothetical protein